jgi:hypothetical protein
MAAGRVRVEVGNRVTQQMTRLPSGEMCGSDPEANLLGLGLVSSGVGNGGSSRWKGVAGRSLIVR